MKFGDFVIILSLRFGVGCHSWKCHFNYVHIIEVVQWVVSVGLVINRSWFQILLWAKAA